MKITIIINLLLMICQFGFAQEQIEWEESIEITLDSFKGEIPDLAEDDVQQYSFAATYDFSFQMIALQFALTKNFNQYVNVYYVPSLSWMEEGDLTDELLLMVNLDFDLLELYARKFRKRMYEAKNIGSDINFFNELHAEINKEYSDRQSIMLSEMNIQENMKDYLISEQAKVNSEIAELSKFCKRCKFDGRGELLNPQVNSFNLIVYRRAKKEKEDTLLITINDSLQFDYIPNSYQEMSFPLSDEKIKVCVNEQEACLFIERNSVTTKYLKVSALKADDDIKLEEIDSRDGEFESYVPMKRQKNRGN